MGCTEKASLPEGDTSGWGGYSLAFNIFPPGKRWTAQSVTAEVTQNLSTFLLLLVKESLMMLRLII